MEKKLFEKLTEFLTDTNRLYEEYVDDSGQLVMSTETLSHLTSAMRSGLEVYNMAVTAEDLKEDADIQGVLSEIAVEVEKIKTTEENAKKLNLQSSINIWETIVGKLMALSILLLASVQVVEDEK